jgi:hypothetical protein
MLCLVIMYASSLTTQLSKYEGQNMYVDPEQVTAKKGMLYAKLQ